MLVISDALFLLTLLLDSTEKSSTDEAGVQFDFLLDREFLRTSLLRHLENKEISSVGLCAVFITVCVYCMQYVCYSLCVCTVYCMCVTLCVCVCVLYVVCVCVCVCVCMYVLYAVCVLLCVCACTCLWCVCVTVCVSV